MRRAPESRNPVPEIAALRRSRGVLPAAIELEPSNFSAHQNLGIVLMRQKKDAAATARSRARSACPRRIPGTGAPGRPLFLPGSDGKSSRILSGCRGQDTGQCRPAQQARLQPGKLGRIQEAAPVLEKAWYSTPSMRIRFTCWRPVFRAEAVRRERGCVQQLLKLNPDQKEVHYNLGTLYAETEQYGAPVWN